jgi:hypothetical protein
MADGSIDRIGARERAQWQRRLLPFAIVAIASLAIAFFAISVIEVRRLADRVTYAPGGTVDAALASVETASASASAIERAELHRWRTLVLMEREVLRQRYAQVNATLLLNAWTRHLGFLTGMILAFVGAVFILSRLSEPATRLSAEGGGLKGQLATSSPGIVLSVLGTVLMVVTLATDFEFTTTDTPVYLASRTPPAEVVSQPLPLGDEAARAVEEAALFGQTEEPRDAP